ncbi:MAG: lipopolysaccharide transport periplasmic protein LptA [Porticoccaceae bacterium]|nr:lipopolysaccharide transport periplasmic protein LptA [Porticoccaceae bacterium]
MANNRHPLKPALMLLCLALASPLVAALPEDRNQAIEIQAREALRNDPKGLTVYEGDVTIRQGSILIRADKVSIYNTGKKVSRIVCIGTPAQFQQQPKADSPLVIAKGNTIEYNLETDIIVLQKNASLVQDESTLSGERIDYDLKQEIIRAKGGDDSNDRVRMVIPPSQQQEAF